MIDKADKLANLWNKTKDPRYKDEWYKHIKEWSERHGHYFTERRNVLSRSSNKKDTGIYKVI